MRLNGDSGANYANMWIQNVTATSASAVPQLILSPAMTANAGKLSGKITLPNYAGTTFIKSIAASLAQSSSNLASASMSYETLAGQWVNTAAITSITLLLSAAGNFNAGSRATLYGLN